ncbi:endonuclease 8-like 1 [Physella acuta]|uniref:endonuclease 8-like 1 n=1 Tax=Physella acuta TaxID=109671 RepID=UPI0027DD36DE|nr:endonuclease 8-like 1 [Physella acuta]XP_059172498.1 endonuclease 8-like 1 [Physella acuta]
MPEGPELFLSSLFVNRICKDIIFGGKVVKNPIHKCQDIEWDEPQYSISAESKGKELMLHLKALNPAEKNSMKNKKQPANSSKINGKSLSIQFSFGMSGKFEFTPADQLLKHSHLSFFTKTEPKMALSFVDYRRFGKWRPEASWTSARGPCVIQEYEDFVTNIVNNLNDAAFNKPICEAMLNQKYFNGIGNYLRAEILYRCKIPPFERASSVLKLQTDDEIKPEETKGGKKPKAKRQPKTEISANNTNGITSEMTDVDNSKKEIKQEEAEQALNENKVSASGKLTAQAQELLRLCHTIPLEVVQLGSTKYTLSEMYVKGEENGEQGFDDWLQCYYQPGMKNMVDHNKRTMWFSGPAGPLAPPESKSRALLKSLKPVKAADNKESDKANNKKKSSKKKGVKPSETVEKHDPENSDLDDNKDDALSTKTETTDEADHSTRKSTRKRKSENSKKGGNSEITTKKSKYFNNGRSDVQISKNSRRTRRSVELEVNSEDVIELKKTVLRRKKSELQNKKNTNKRASKKRA